MAPPQSHFGQSGRAEDAPPGGPVHHPPPPLRTPSVSTFLPKNSSCCLLSTAVKDVNFHSPALLPKRCWAACRVTPSATPSSPQECPRRRAATTAPASFSSAVASCPTAVSTASRALQSRPWTRLRPTMPLPMVERRASQLAHTAIGP